MATDIAGLDLEVGAEVGLKAELGVEFGDSTHIDLPLLSVDVPTPVVGVALGAAMDLVTDPVGTVTDAAQDVYAFGSDVVDVVGDAGGAVIDVGGAVGEWPRMRSAP